jgi:ribulose-phosphate 3-epimerase
MAYLISPSILSADFTRLGEEIQAVEAGGADWIHVDVMDGRFVPNITMGPFIVEACRRVTQLPIDVHLMIVEPERYIEPFAKAGANILSVHIETSPHIYRTLQSIRALGCKAGVVLNPGTPAGSLRSITHLVDMVLVMMVNPGYSGQHFEHAVVPKIREVRQMFDEAGLPVMIEVDGGITPETLPLTLQAGADVFVAATSVYKHPEGPAAGVRALRATFPA